MFGPGFHAAPLLLRLLVLDLLEGAQSVMQTTVLKWGLVWGWTGLVVGVVGLCCWPLPCHEGQEVYYVSVPKRAQNSIPGRCIQLVGTEIYWGFGLRG